MTDNTPLNATARTPLMRLHETRLKRWHQDGEALLSFENLRSWLNTAGLVLFVPRPQIASPAPSLTEAVLGATTPAPTIEQTADARSLMARMIAEGIAVPLNLLGATGGAVGETPDFVASAAVFSYIFTLRGDKTWKQPPSTSGTNKVSALAAHTYEILAKSGPRSASDLTPELGNAVTEVAVLRALGELWAHLRVLPLPQANDRPTLWELTSSRFTKQIKAGANAGQPSALSALISLYLGQVAVATEEDIEIFLSPLAARSRVRDVIHALTAARELETVAIEGRTMVHLSGETPQFLGAADEAEPRELLEETPLHGEAAGDEAAQDETAAEAGEGPRIKKFVPKPRKVGTGYLAKGAPAKGAARSFSKERGTPGKRPAFGAADRGKRPAFGGRDRGERAAGGPSRRADRGGREGFAGRPERERRPFQKARPEGDTRPKFDRPWDEERPKHPPRRDDERPKFAGTRNASERPRPARETRGAGEGGGWKPAFREKSRTERPPFREGGSRPPRREGGFAPRREGAAQGPREGGFAGRAERPSRFAKGPSVAKPPFRRDEERGNSGEGQADRPARPFRRFDERPGAKRPFTRREEGGAPGARPPRPFRPRPEGTEDRAARPFRPRREGVAEGRAPRPFRPRTEGGEERRGGGDRPQEFGGRDRKPAKFASKFAGKRPGPRGEGGFSPRPRPGGKPGERPFGGKGTSGKRPAKRTFKRKEDESA